MLHWYGLIVGIAVVTGWSVAERLDERVGKVMPWVIVGALVGARLYHVIDLWEYYSVNGEQIIAVWDGGLGIWGAVVGGVIGLRITYYVLCWERAEWWKMLGAIATALPLVQAIGRLANAVNSEFTEKVGLLPWWGAELIGDLVLFGVIGGLTLRGSSSQARVGCYLIGYGSIRFALEFWRQNNWVVGGLGVAQWWAIASIVIGLFTWQRSVRD